MEEIKEEKDAVSYEEYSYSVKKCESESKEIDLDEYKH